jgi:hypothetical protein
MVRGRSLALAALLLSNWLTAAVFADTPARLAVGKVSIEERLRVPDDTPPGRYTIHCEAVFDARGFVPVTSCYYLEEGMPRKLLDAVVRAVRRSRSVPATRAGRRVDVFAQVMVLIDTTLSRPLVLAVPNNGIEREKYGLLYTAPQRFNEFTFQSRPVPLRAMQDPMLVWQELVIDERGRVVEFNLRNASGAIPQLVEDVEASVKKMEFMPGYDDEDRAVTMRYIEPAYSVPTSVRLR